jgi:hypothetical protein
LTDRLSQPQKVVVVIALGMAFGAAGTYLTGRGNTIAGGGPFSGAGWEWSPYMPLSQGDFFGSGDTGLHGWQRLLIWLGLIGLGALMSVRVLRPAPEQAPRD